MRLEIIRDEAGFAALESVWDSLLKASATRSPFLAWDYVRLWWEEFQHHFQLCLGVVKDESGTVRGIAPFVIGTEMDGGRQHLRHLGFINGLGQLQGERLDLLVPAGQEAEITPLLARVIANSRARWDVVRLNKVPEESPNQPILMAELRRTGSLAGVLNRSYCHCFPLPATWEAYEATKPGNFRRNIRRYWSILTTKLEAIVAVAGQEISPAEAMQKFFELHAMHWPDGVSSFLRPAAKRLHQKLCLKWIPTGEMQLSFIMVDGAAVGAVYAFCYLDELYVYQLGWNPAFAHVSMGNMSVRACVFAAIQRGLKLVDFLPGDYRYKREWSGDKRVLIDMECFHQWRPRALLFCLLRWAKRRFDLARNISPAPVRKSTASESAE
jgi:CelD/BcsL family acetyltransferase involved in cellulose biosynthesis